MATTSPRTEHSLTLRTPFSVAYAGPATLRGRVTPRADMHSATRVVAVTFMLTPRPLGTVTSAPCALDVDTVLLPVGKAYCGSSRRLVVTPA
jgi:hypothetical protein